MAKKKEEEKKNDRPSLGWGLAERAAKRIESRGLQVDEQVGRMSGGKKRKKKDKDKNK